MMRRLVLSPFPPSPLKALADSLEVSGTATVEPP